jgi:large subunit ribosomal protein L10
MKKEEKDQVIEDLKVKLANTSHFYLADTATLTADKTTKLRRMCFDRKIKMLVVKNTLLKKAMERTEGRDYKEMIPALKGTTAIFFSESGSEPAKLFKEFRGPDGTVPGLKAAYVEESIYFGPESLDVLAAIKSKNELIGDVIALLQSPSKNVISALLSGKNKLAGVVKTLSERPE